MNAAEELLMNVADWLGEMNDDPDATFGAYPNVEHLGNSLVISPDQNPANYGDGTGTKAPKYPTVRITFELLGGRV